jgi:hypothetical protein
MQARRQHVPDWEHLVFLSAIVAFLIWYVWDATAASPTFSNLILIAPAAAAAFTLALYIATVEILGRGALPQPARRGGEAPAPPVGPSRFRPAAVGAIAGLMALFAAFVIAIPYAGFDIASFAFVVMTLWLLGERRIIVTLMLALSIAAGVSAAAIALLTVPIPMAVAGRLWSAL